MHISIICSNFAAQKMYKLLFMSEKKVKNTTKEVVRGNWQEHLGKYLIDISKYVVTGVIITSFFKDIDNKIFIYIVSAIISIVALIVGLIFTSKKKGE